MSLSNHINFYVKGCPATRRVLKKRGKKTTRKWLLVLIHEDLDKKKNRKRISENRSAKTETGTRNRKSEFGRKSLILGESPWDTDLTQRMICVSQLTL